MKNPTPVIVQNSLNDRLIIHNGLSDPKAKLSYSHGGVKLLEIAGAGCWKNQFWVIFLVITLLVFTAKQVNFDRWCISSND